MGRRIVREEGTEYITNCEGERVAVNAALFYENEWITKPQEVEVCDTGTAYADTIRKGNLNKWLDMCQQAAAERERISKEEGVSLEQADSIRKSRMGHKAEQKVIDADEAKKEHVRELTKIRTMRYYYRKRGKPLPQHWVEAREQLKN